VACCRAAVQEIKDEAPLQLAAVQLSHCVWGLHAWGPRGSDPTAGEVTAADPVPRVSPPDPLASLEPYPAAAAAAAGARERWRLVSGAPGTQAASGGALLVDRLGEARTARGGHRATDQRPPAGRSRSQPRLPRGETRAECRGGLQQCGTATPGKGARRPRHRSRQLARSLCSKLDNSKVNFSNFVIPYSYFCILVY